MAGDKAFESFFELGEHWVLQYGERMIWFVSGGKVNWK